MELNPKPRIDWIMEVQGEGRNLKPRFLEKERSNQGISREGEGVLQFPSLWEGIKAFLEWPNSTSNIQNKTFEISLPQM